jgi:hypothetical protein
MEKQPELNEEQFFFLKGLCEQNAFIAVLPDFRPDAPEQLKINHASVLEKFDVLVKMGFLEPAGEQFAPEIAEMKRKTGIGFTPFVVTDQTFKMFGAKEGSVN